MRVADCHPDKKHFAKGMCHYCYLKEYRTDNPDKRKEWAATYREQHAEQIHAYNKKRYEENKPRIQAGKTAYHGKRLREDPLYRLEHNLRNRIYKATKRGSRNASAVRDLGCSISHFKLYLENQFEDGMTWDNYGTGWHLDHVIPVSHYDLSDRMQTLEAFNWLNYQPFWARDNLVKGARK